MRSLILFIFKVAPSVRPYPKGCIMQTVVIMICVWPCWPVSNRALGSSYIIKAEKTGFRYVNFLPFADQDFVHNHCVGMPSFLSSLCLAKTYLYFCLRSRRQYRQIVLPAITLNILKERKKKVFFFYY